jgi:hypothetical protein
MTWERIIADDARVGDKIAYSRKHDPELVIEQHHAERTNVLHLRRLVDSPGGWGKAGDLRRVYPHDHIKLWRVVES